MAAALNSPNDSPVTWRSALWVLAAYISVIGALFIPLLAKGRVIAGSDALFQFLPLYEEPSTPWVDTVFGGYPAFADPQGLRHYPLSQLMQVLGFSFNAFTVAGLVLSAWFAHLTALVLTRRHVAASLAGLAYGLSAFFFIHLVHVTMVHAGAWMAASVFCLVQWHFTARRGWLTLLALCVALLVLAGAPQLAVYGLGWLGVLAVAIGVRRRNAWHGLWPVLALVAGLGISAVQVIPTAELVGFTPRAALTRDDFLSNAFEWADLPAAVVPRAYQTHKGPFPASSDGDLHVTVGLTCLLLAVYALFSRSRRFWAVTFVALAAVSLLLSFRPVAGLFFSLPIYNLFRGPTRHHLFWALWLSLGSALGAAALIEKKGRLRWRELAAMAGTLLFFFSPWFTGWPSAPARAYLFVFFWLAAWVGLKASAHRGWVLGVLALGFIEPFVNIYAMPAWRDSPPMNAAALSPRVLELGKECRQEGCRLFPWNGFWSGGLPGNLSRLYDVPSLSGYNVMYLRRLGELLQMDANGHVIEKGVLLNKGNRALDVLGVRYLLVADDELGLLAEDAGYQFKGKAGSDSAVKNDGAMPRAWFVSRHETVTDAQAMQAVRTGVLPSGEAFELSQLVALEGQAPVVPASETTVTIETVARPGQLKLRLGPHQGGVLVLNDMWYPGWKAVANGGPRPVMRAKAVQLGVVLEAGDVSVTVEFSSLTRRMGGVLSVLSALVALALSWRMSQMPLKA